MRNVLQKFGEMMMYGGYTYEDACRAAGGGGGGKDGGGGTTVVEAAPVPTQTSLTTPSSVSNLLTSQAENFDEKDAVEKEQGIQKKKLGTRGLQIPIARGETAPTAQTYTPATSGIQI